MELIINGNIFYPTAKYTKETHDLGITYENYELSEEDENYIITYEVPNYLVDKKMYYKYNDEYDNNYKVKLNPINLDNKKNISTKLNTNKKIENNIFNGLEINLKSYEINEVFSYTYNFCVKNNECYSSKDNIRPKLNKNYDESLIKLNVTATFNDSYKNTNMKNLKNILGDLAVIKYRLNNSKNYKYSILEFNKKYKDDYYFDVNSEIKEASEIILEIRFRNEIIEYKLK